MSVMIPRSQRQDPEDRGTPNVIQQASLAFMVPVKWYDEQGRPKTEFMFIVPDYEHPENTVVWRDKAGDEFASRLVPLPEKMAAPIIASCHNVLRQAVMEVLREAGVTLTPEATRDEVNVFADDTDKDVSTKG